jgi:hypothetical protein
MKNLIVANGSKTCHGAVTNPGTVYACVVDSGVRTLQLNYLYLQILHTCKGQMASRAP